MSALRHHLVATLLQELFFQVSPKPHLPLETSPADIHRQKNTAEQAADK
jgi:hypothetical protein